MFSWLWPKKKRKPKTPRSKHAEISLDQREVIDDLVSIYSEGELFKRRPYAHIEIFPDGRGIQYGFANVNAQSGELQALIEHYYKKGAHLTSRGDKMPKIQAINTASRSAGLSSSIVTLDVTDLIDALYRAASEPLMMEAQREIFDLRYWSDAFSAGQALGCRYPLTFAILADMFAHSNSSATSRGTSRLWKLQQELEAQPPSQGGGERAWIQAIAFAHLEMLETHPRADYQRAAARARSQIELIDDALYRHEVWYLPRPLYVAMAAPSGRKVFTIEEKTR